MLAFAIHLCITRVRHCALIAIRPIERDNLRARQVLIHEASPTEDHRTVGAELQVHFPDGTANLVCLTFLEDVADTTGLNPAEVCPVRMVPLLPGVLRSFLQDISQRSRPRARTIAGSKEARPTLHLQNGLDCFLKAS